MERAVEACFSCPARTYPSRAIGSRPEVIWSRTWPEIAGRAGHGRADADRGAKTQGRRATAAQAEYEFCSGGALSPVDVSAYLHNIHYAKFCAGRRLDPVYGCGPVDSPSAQAAGQSLRAAGRAHRPVARQPCRGQTRRASALRFPAVAAGAARSLPPTCATCAASTTRATSIAWSTARRSRLALRPLPRPTSPCSPARRWHLRIGWRRPPLPRGRFFGGCGRRAWALPSPLQQWLKSFSAGRARPDWKATSVATACGPGS